MEMLLLILLLTFGILPGQHQIPVAHKALTATLNIAQLKAKRAAADKYLKQHNAALILYARVPGKMQAIKVKNEEWPEEVEASYTILKDASGKVIMILESPFSQSGDWSITYTHYFDDAGNTYAYKKETNVFDDVKGGVIYGTQINYYSINFKPLAKSTILLDKYGTKVKDIGHINVYDSWYKHSIYKNLKECLAGYLINAG
jgi:hypothetical protein